MKTEWLNEVVSVLRATVPPLPGKTDPVLKVLDEVANDLYSKCWNGEKVGSDGCPVCRAHATEVARHEAEVSSKNASAYKNKSEEQERVINELKDQLATLIDSFEDLAGELESQKRSTEKYRSEFKRAQSSEEVALRERAQWEANYNSVTKDLKEVEEKFVQAQSVVAKYRYITSLFGEVN